MNTQIKIDLSQAAEYTRLGYTVTCFVSVPKLQPKVRRRNNSVIQSDALYTFNPTGKHPQKGNYKEVWDKTNLELWGGDIKAKYSRDHIVAKLHRHGLSSTDASMFAWLANKQQIIKPAPE